MNVEIHSCEYNNKLVGVNLIWCLFSEIIIVDYSLWSIIYMAWAIALNNGTGHEYPFV